MDWTLDRSILDTIRYYDIFNLPLTATQIWRSLIVSRDGTGLRWSGHAVTSLAEVDKALKKSDWLKERTSSHWGYYGLKKDAEPIEGRVKARLYRHVLSQKKWKITRRVVSYLQYVPFVRMIGITGSLAMANTRKESDLDLLVVAKKNRIWMARLSLLLVVQLLGKRRKHWDELAPDKICLNHYITDQSLAMSSDIHNIYTAVLYSHLIPIAGLSVYKEWLAENEQWIKGHLMYPEQEEVPSRKYVRTNKWLANLQKFFEAFLTEPIGDLLEMKFENIQRKKILAHTRPGRAGRVVSSDDELAFHPDSKQSMVVAKFAAEYGQGKLL